MITRTVRQSDSCHFKDEDERERSTDIPERWQEEMLRPALYGAGEQDTADKEIETVT